MFSTQVLSLSGPARLASLPDRILVTTAFESVMGVEAGFAAGAEAGFATGVAAGFATGVAAGFATADIFLNYLKIVKIEKHINNLIL